MKLHRYNLITVYNEVGIDKEAEKVKMDIQNYVRIFSKAQFRHANYARIISIICSYTCLVSINKIHVPCICSKQ